jgi:membrane protein
MLNVMTHELPNTGARRAFSPRRFTTMIVDRGGYALRRYKSDSSLQAASSLTYTTLLSLVPLLAIAFAIFAAFPAFQGAREQLEAAVFENLVPGVGGDIRTHLTGFLENAGQLGTVGVVGLGLSALLLLSTIEATFNRIWRVKRPRPLVVRFLLYWGILTMGPLLIGAGITLTTDVFSVARQGLSEAGLDSNQLSMETGGLGDQLWSILLQTILFSFLFMVVPNRRVGWRDALLGGVVGAAGFQILKIGFAWYLANVFTYQAIYGAMAAFPIFLIWLYLSWCVILLGATFAASAPEWGAARLSDAVTDGDPGRILASALQVLKILKDASRDGRETSADQLAIAGGETGPILDPMLAHNFIQTTKSGGFVLSRDLEVATVFDLYRSLGLNVLNGRADASPDSDTDEVDRILNALDLAERTTLDLPIHPIVSKMGHGADDGSRNSGGS